MKMKPENLTDIQKSFTAQARKFEDREMNFSKQEYLEYTVRAMALSPSSKVLEVAAGTCVCGRAVAPLVRSVICLDATPAMLAVGAAEAKKSGLSNIQFLEGVAEELPFKNQQFDVVLSRLAFHHFLEMERPFAEMSRVLKTGGELAIIDLEAAEESLRETEDAIETMRDASHVQNHSRAEFLALYEKYGYRVQKQEITLIPVALKAWLALTNTPEQVSERVRALLQAELDGGMATGFQPYMARGEIYFRQRWVLFIGKKLADEGKKK